MILLKCYTFLQNIFHNLFLKGLKFKEIGDNVVICLGFNILCSDEISFGENIYIGPYCNLYGHGGIIIKSGVIVGPRLTVYSANHNFKNNLQSIPYDFNLEKKKVVIEENVWIGGNVLIVPGVMIGEGAIVAAGSVVTRNVTPFDIVGGNPAKKIGERNKDEYLRLKNEGKIYFKLKNEIKI